MFRIAAASIAIAAALTGPAFAGCHLDDCVENVPINAHQLKGKSCEDLWVLRNSIYKDAKYCFATPRAMKRFGNEGCQFEQVGDVPLGDTQRHNVGVIRSVEKKDGC